MINYSRSTGGETQIPTRAHSPPKKLWLSLGIPSRPRVLWGGELFGPDPELQAVHRPTIFSLQIGEGAYEDKNRDGFINRSPCSRARRFSKKKWKRRLCTGCQLFTFSLFYLEFLNNNTVYGQATLETYSHTIPFLSKWVIDYSNTSSNYTFKLP